MSISEIERKLEAYYEQHRNQQLASQLEDAVQTMGQTLLLGAKYEELPDERKDETDEFTPRDETVQKVEQVKEAWETNQFDKIEDQLPELTGALNREEQRVRGNIQAVKHELKSHLRGLKSLNQRTNRVQSRRIQVIGEEIENLDEVSYKSNQEFIEQEQNTRRHVRENLIVELEETETELMEPFQDSGAQKHVHSLIFGESVQLSSLSNDEITELQRSLGVHLSLQLRGDNG